MKKKLFKKFKWLMPVFLILSISCTDSEKSGGHNSNVPIVITKITPDTGGMATDMLIEGQNFSPNKKDITVTINGKSATVIGSTQERIFVIVPKRPETEGFVEVTIGEQKSNQIPFVYITTEVVETLAGTGTSGDADGSGNEAQFKFSDMPGISFQSTNEGVIIADPGNNKIRTIDPQGVVRTVRSSGLNKPMHAIYDKDGNMYIANCDASNILKISAESGEETIVGTMGWPTSMAYDAETDRVFAVLYSGGDIMVVKDKNAVANGDNSNMEKFLSTSSYNVGFMTFDDGNLYFTANGSHAIYVLKKGNTVPEVFAGIPGSAGITVEATEATQAKITSPSGLAFAPNGDLYFATGAVAGGTSSDNKIYMVRKSDNKLLPFIGKTVSGNNDGNAHDATFNSPAGLVIDKENTIYVVDKLNHKVRRVVVQ